MAWNEPAAARSDAHPALVWLLGPDEVRCGRIKVILQAGETGKIQIIKALDAIPEAPAQAPDVVLLDAAASNAEKTLVLLKRLPLLAGVPVLAMRETAGSDTVEALLQAGADDVFTQPPAAADLGQRVRLLLRLRRTARELQSSNEQRAKQSHAMLTILDLCGHLNFAETLTEVLKEVVRAAATLTHSRQAVVLLPDAEQKILQAAEGLGLGPAALADWRVPVGQGPLGRVYAAGEALLVAQLQTPEEGLPGGLARPYACAPLRATAAGNAPNCTGVLCVSERHGNEAYTPMDLECLEMLGSFAGAAAQGVLHRAWREQAQDALVLALVGLTEQRNRDTAQHLERVTAFAGLLAEELRGQPRFAEIDEAFLLQLRRAMPLHDIGKVAIPDSILLKPSGLTPLEKEVMQSHAAIGADTIASVRTQLLHPAFVRMAEDIARHHHEWFDGGGYPAGLRGEQIPLAARLAAVADVYDALTTKRVYKPALSHEAALNILCNAAGRQFDPQIVEALLRRQAEFKRCAERLRDIEIEAEAAAPRTAAPTF